ncbi:MAG: phosphate signaling complex protein PhoU [Bacteroidales bacterium]|nr:phosphate signaling complex protein PhoU [Bacteroidales bacterium]
MVQKVEAEMEQLRKDTLEMWKLVYNQMQQAGEAVLTLNKDMARQVILRERRVNAFELKIDRDVEDVIALYNPVAVQLRFTLAIMRINSNLERIGDFADGMAHFVVEFKEPVLDPDLVRKLQLSEMIDQVLLMFQTLFDALEKENADLAVHVFEMDQLVDEIYHGCYQRLKAFILEDPEANALNALQLVGIFRKLERVGDHCTNLAEEIVFFLDAKVLKHQGKTATEN